MELIQWLRPFSQHLTCKLGLWIVNAVAFLIMIFYEL